MRNNFWSGLAILVCGILNYSTVEAQSLNLRDLTPDLVRDGILLAPPLTGTNHSAHFLDSGQFESFRAINDAIGRQISNIPISTSAGGFAFEYDPDLMIYSRKTRTFGSTYSERPFTLGKGKFNVGVNFSRFTFDEIDDVNLREGNIKLLFTHADFDNDGPTNPPFEGDVVTAAMFWNLDSDITSLVATYGLTDRFDLAVAIPIVEVNTQVSLAAHVETQSTGDAEIHQFANGTTDNIVTRSGSASGVGDILLRGKYLFLSNDPNYVAFTGDVRFPSGDEKNLLGSGDFRAQGALGWAYDYGDLSPRATVGFGVSSERDELLYGLGLDWALDPKLSVAFDILGRQVSEGGKAALAQKEVTYNDGTIDRTTTFDQITFDESASLTQLDGSVGFKLNIRGTWLITANGFFPLTKNGLRDEFSPLIGIDYGF